MILVEPSTTEYLCFSLSAYNQGGLTGRTVTVAIRRASDGYYLDHADGTYKSSGWTTKNATMTEIGGGHYQYAWTVGALTVGTQYVAEYLCSGVTAQSQRVRIVKSVADVPGKVWDEALSGHTTAGTSGKTLSDAATASALSSVASSVAAVPAAVWDVTASGHNTSGTTGYALNVCRKAITNRVVEASGDPNGTMTLYEDDDSTVCLTQQLTDEDGGAVTGQAGAPARRSKAT
jgi:hypothetical protein